MTVSTGECFPVCSRTLQIILRSKSHSVSLGGVRLTVPFCRVLLATIRDMGICPCPRCLVPKTEFDRLGLLSDMSRRISQVRTYLRDKVAAARNAIYKLGSPIKGTVPEAHLKAMSLVPTFVSASGYQTSFGRSYKLRTEHDC